MYSVSCRTLRFLNFLVLCTPCTPSTLRTYVHVLSLFPSPSCTSSSSSSFLPPFRSCSPPPVFSPILSSPFPPLFHLLYSFFTPSSLQVIVYAETCIYYLGFLHFFFLFFFYNNLIFYINSLQSKITKESYKYHLYSIFVLYLFENNFAEFLTLQ